MAYRILIVDDDREFNTLLADVYKQAGYQVVSASNAQQGLELFSMQSFDLVVSDHLMPDRTGLEFARDMYQIRRDVPVIMVSGYLDSRTIRELIREGVNGVCIKPLNIFSLLKRSTELIQKFKQQGKGSATDAGSAAVGAAPTLPFAFSTFPCVSAKSLEFARKAHAMKDFSKCLLIIGAEGTDYLSLASDFAQWQGESGGTLVFQPDSFDEVTINTQIEGLLDEQIRHITIMILQGEALTEQSRDCLYQLSAKTGAFERWRPYEFRFIVCLERELDALYDEGVVDETFYIFLGSRELTIPALSEIPEDIPLLAVRYLQLARPDLKLDYSTHAFLMRRKWPGNANALREFIEAAAEKCTDSDVLTIDHFQAGQRAEQSKPIGTSDDNPLQAHLRALRDDYISAALLLCNGDIARVAAVLQCESSYIKAFTHNSGSME